MTRGDSTSFSVYSTTKAKMHERHNRGLIVRAWVRYDFEQDHFSLRLVVFGSDLMNLARLRSHRYDCLYTQASVNYTQLSYSACAGRPNDATADLLSLLRRRSKSFAYRRSRTAKSHVGAKVHSKRSPFCILIRRRSGSPSMSRSSSGVRSAGHT